MHTAPQPGPLELQGPNMRAGKCGALLWGMTRPSLAIPERHILWQTQGSEMRQQSIFV